MNAPKSPRGSLVHLHIRKQGASLCPVVGEPPFLRRLNGGFSPVPLGDFSTGIAGFRSSLLVSGSSVAREILCEYTIVVSVLST